MKLFFEYFPADLSPKLAMKMMHKKMHEAYEGFEKSVDKEEDSKYYLECLEKLKDMITIYLQETKEIR